MENRVHLKYQFFALCQCFNIWLSVLLPLVTKFWCRGIADIDIHSAWLEKKCLDAEQSERDHEVLGYTSLFALVIVFLFLGWGAFEMAMCITFAVIDIIEDGGGLLWNYLQSIS